VENSNQNQSFHILVSLSKVESSDQEKEKRGESNH
jgi:hypothetical protein